MPGFYRNRSPLDNRGEGRHYKRKHGYAARDTGRRLERDVRHVADQVEDFLQSPTAQYATPEIMKGLEDAVKELAALFSLGSSPKQRDYKMPDMTYTRKQIKEAVEHALKSTKII